jgi:predicted site-specific integrase-resolvase
MSKYIYIPRSSDGEFLYNRKQAAAYLGVSVNSLGLWACNGKYSLPYIKLGRYTRYKKKDLDALLERRTKTHDKEIKND